MTVLPSPAQSAGLATGVFRTVALWRVTRRDGEVFGWTDHDRVLEHDGCRFVPGLDLSTGEVDAGSGLAAGQAPVRGRVSDAVITSADLAAGLWDGARIEVWCAEWDEVERAVHVASGELGDIREGPDGFEADMLGPAVRLEQVRGRTYSHTCDARLGDARCGVPADHSGFVAGCDQSFRICRDRFSNVLNFRGFPYQSGNDDLFAGPERAGPHDGRAKGQVRS